MTYIGLVTALALVVGWLRSWSVRYSRRNHLRASRYAGMAFVTYPAPSSVWDTMDPDVGGYDCGAD